MKIAGININKFQIPLFISVAALGFILILFNTSSDNKTADNSEIPNNNQSVQVEQVIDGDTFVTKNGDHVRILGIDAPEGNQCYEDESRDRLISLIEGRIVTLEKEEVDVDNYGRKLRHVFRGDLLISSEMIRGGFATHLSKRKLKYAEELEQAELYAKENNLGLWGNCKDFVPIDYDDSATRREKDASPPSEECLIKGNISEAGFGRTYSYPGCPNYEQVKINPDKGEEYFCTIEEAESAGYVRQETCPAR